MGGHRKRVVREYYRCIDEDDYERLRSILTADFVHDRPDMTLEDRNAFVSFMREERPDPDTEHVVEAVYDGDGRAAAEGRLLRSDDSVWFRFVDTFEFDGDEVASVRTYVHGS
ncbi:MAG: nuclear transport factor 2 family protein [Natronomonas sp.]